MGRHKYDTNRRAHRAEDPASADNAVDAPLGLEAQQTTTGEAVFDVAKDIAKRVGAKAVGRLARESGRKVGKEIVSRTLGNPTPYVGYPIPQATPAARAANASLGPSAQQPTPSARAAPRPSSETANVWGGKEVAGDRIREILEANSLERKKTSPSKRQDKGRLGESNKANEAISRLLAEDD